MRQVPEVTCKTALCSCQRGAILVEAAFTLPILALVFLIILDGGFAIREHQLLQNAAREGARFACLDRGVTAAQVKQIVVDYCVAEKIVVNPADVVLSPYSIPLGGNLYAQGTQVTVSYSRQMLFVGMPLLPSNRIALRGTAIFRNLY